MKQTSFAGLEYAGKKRRTRREKFLGEMERVVPWTRLIALIEPHYPRSGKVGRPPIGVARMLRMYFLQQWYSLSDEGLEDAIYDSHAMRDFVGIDLGREQVPDATTLLKFRRLLEDKQLTAAVFEAINGHLCERGLLMREGTLVDATIIAAPPSTKNEDRARDPEMHQAKKGNQWHFGMKAHIGVDAESGLVHSMHATAANESDVAHITNCCTVRTCACMPTRATPAWTSARRLPRHRPRATSALTSTGMWPPSAASSRPCPKASTRI